MTLDILTIIRTGGRVACGPQGWLFSSARAARAAGMTREQWMKLIAAEGITLADNTLLTQWSLSKRDEAIPHRVSVPAPAPMPAPAPATAARRFTRPRHIKVPRDPGCRLDPMMGQWVCPGCNRTYGRHFERCLYCR